MRETKNSQSVVLED